MKHHYKAAIRQLQSAIAEQPYGRTTGLSWRQCCRMPLSVLRQWIEKLEQHLILWGPYSESIDDEDGQGVRTFVTDQWKYPWNSFDPYKLARHYHADPLDGLGKDARGTGHLFCALLKLLWVREFARAKHEARPLPVLMRQPLANRRLYMKPRRQRWKSRQSSQAVA